MSDLDLTAVKDGPWYTRSEFWTTVFSSIMGLVPYFSPQSAPLVKGIGIAISGLAPIVYGVGRSNVKQAKVTAISNQAGKS